MLIGDLVAKTGFTRDTIRFYEKQGLIRIGRKERRANNYKEYPESIFKKLMLIKKLKGFGFTLNEIIEYLELIDNNTASCTQVSGKVTLKIEQIDQKINELLDVRTAMVQLVTTCVTCCRPANQTDNCPILTD